jgi:hypothetical protein
VSLQGAALWADADANRAFARRGPGEAAAAEALKRGLDALCAPAAVILPARTPPPPLPAPRDIGVLPPGTGLPSDGRR